MIYPELSYFFAFIQVRILLQFAFSLSIYQVRASQLFQPIRAPWKVLLALLFLSSGRWTPSHILLLCHALRLLITPRPCTWHAAMWCQLSLPSLISCHSFQVHVHPRSSLTASRHLLHAEASVAAGAQLLAAGKPGGQFLPQPASNFFLLA